MHVQSIYLTAITPASNMASVTLQQAGTLFAVSYNVFPLITLGAGDECCYEIETSLNPAIAQASLLSPPNAVLAKDILSACCDIAGTTVAYVNAAKAICPVPDRRLSAGQIVYLNGGMLVQRAGGVAVFYGYVNLHFK